MNPRPAQWERPDFVSHCVFCNMPVMCAPVQVRPHSATFPFRESLLERISQNSDSFFLDQACGVPFSFSLRPFVCRLSDCAPLLDII